MPTTSAPCTCNCPDGEEQHLENCEAYLRYWEIDKLERITNIFDNVILYWIPAARREKIKAELLEMLAESVAFTQSTSEPGMECSVSDPMQIIRRHINRPRQPLYHENQLGSPAPFDC